MRLLANYVNCKKVLRNIISIPYLQIYVSNCLPRRRYSRTLRGGGYNLKKITKLKDTLRILLLHAFMYALKQHFLHRIRLGTFYIYPKLSKFSSILDPAEIFDSHMPLCTHKCACRHLRAMQAFTLMRYLCSKRYQRWPITPFLIPVKANLLDRSVFLEQSPGRLVSFSSRTRP